MGCYCTAREVRPEKLEVGETHSEDKDSIEAKVDRIFRKYDSKHVGAFTKHEFKAILRVTLSENHKYYCDQVL